jgi:O-antigen ligase
MRGYIAVIIIVALLATAAYFRLLGGLSDMFLIFGRAKGTFKDPNVFGAFLILPALFMLQRILGGRRSEAIGGTLLLLALMAGLFLSFSRAAWGQFVFCALIVMALRFLTSDSTSERFRIVVVAIAGLVAITAFVAALLSIERVAALFQERAALTQSYDTGHFGRFGRYLLAMQMVLEHPFGMGALQFQFPEAPHNTYLNSFINGGWIGGGAYLTLTLITVTAGLKFAFTPTPWRTTFQAFYAAFLGLVAESVIIDSDHWRHYFLVLGVLWGLMAVSRPYMIAVREQRAAQAALQGA